MPTYDFTCEACGRVTESRQPISAAAIDCRCGAPAARSPFNRVGVSGFAFVPYDQRRLRKFDDFATAQHDLIHDAAKQGTQLPDFLKIAEHKVATGQAAAEAGDR